MNQRGINATLTITALALTTLLIPTALPQAGTAAPTAASLSTNPKRISEPAEAHSLIRSPFVDSSPGTTTRLSAALHSSPVMFIENMERVTSDPPFHSLLIADTYVATAQAFVQNLIVNGDFESGNMGFFSDYRFSAGNIWPEGVYDVLSNPRNAHGNAASFGDHTSGSGLMMAINGARLAGVTVWSQAVNVMQNTDYSFSAWIASWTSASPAQLQFQINDSVVGIFTAPSTPGIWQEFTTTWNSGFNTSATIRIVDLNTIAVGNDFALDDLSFAVASGPSFSISNLEVTQATQDGSNSVPLIADKPTFVRVYVSCPPDGEVPSNAAIALRGFGPSGELGAPLAPFGGYLRTACRESLEAQRADLRKTLNFALPTVWTQGTVRLRAEVQDAMREQMFTFQAGHNLRIAWAAMPYVPPQPPPQPGQTPVVVRPDLEAAGKGATDLLLMYPVAPENVTYFFQPGFDQLMREPFTCSDNYCPADTQYLTALNNFWNRMAREGHWVGGSPPDRLYGWIPQAAQGNLCGFADAIWANPQRRRGRVAAGVDSCGAQTLAHELGHLLDSAGLRHAPGCGAAGHDPSYPNPDGSIGEWGVRITEGGPELLDPDHTYDFMSYCSPEWVSPYHYRRLNQGFAPTGMVMTTQTLTTPQKQLLASGIVFTPAMTVTLNPLFAITSTVPPDPDTGSVYCLELRDAGETPLDRRCFDLTFTNPETGEPIEAEGFSLALPYPEGTQAVVMTHYGTELARVTTSLNTPQVEVLSPNGGEVWQASGAYTVTWTASDADGGTLHYAVSFSPDGGASWIPLVLDTTQTEYVVDTSRLPGTAYAVIRVEASDGFNTGMDVSDAYFTVGRKGPQAFILSPEEPITVTEGTPLWLQGYAYDLEDGSLADAALSWTSSRDGDLGTGSTVLASLSLGHHTVTFITTDSNGNQASATTQVLVTFAEDLVPDCRVDAADLQAVAGRWRQTAGARFDLDGDGVVSVVDIMQVAARWGHQCDSGTPPTPTPTPSNTPTLTPTSTPTPTPSHTPTLTPTSTPTPTFTHTPTFTRTSTATSTSTPSSTPTLTPTPTPTATPVSSMPPDYTWQLIAFNGVGVTRIAFSPDYANDQTVYVITLDGTNLYLHRSTDGLRTWFRVSELGSQVRHVAFSPNYANDQTIFVIITQGLFQSTDRGLTWSQRAAWPEIGLTVEVTAFELSPDFAHDQTMFLGTADGRIWHSTDAGATWIATAPLYDDQHAVRSIGISPNYQNDHTIFAGVGQAWDWYNGGVFRSTDGGVSWMSVNNGLTYREVGSLAVSPNYATDRTLYVTVWAGGLFRSTDSGDSWADANDGQPNRRLSYVTFSPSYGSDRSMALGTWGEYTDGGIYLSVDGGNTWAHRSNGLATRWIHSVAYSPNYANDGILLAGGEQSNGGGLWLFAPSSSFISGLCSATILNILGAVPTLGLQLLHSSGVFRQLTMAVTLRSCTRR